MKVSGSERVPKREPMEKLLWSVALPGFGQLLNGKILKALLLIALEIIINVQSNLNQVIFDSFHGDIQLAIEQTSYPWLMFYPCTYMFAIWDAYRDAGGGQSAHSYLPFVLSAYFGTIGVIYSSDLKIIGVLFGPVFLPILFLFIGAGIGWVIQTVLRKIGSIRRA